MVQRIVAGDDPRLAAFFGVRDPELVRGRGQFIAEGRVVVRRAIEDGRYRVRAVLVNDAARAQLAEALASLPSDTPVFVCETAMFATLTGYNIHRGCLALVDRPAPNALEDVLAEAATVVVLDAVANADNVGAIFRNAAAFGCGGVILGPACCDPFYRKAIRTSMGAVLGLPFVVAEPWPAALRRVRAAGFMIAALTPREPAIDLDTFARERPPRVAIAAGAEGDGLSAEIESIADARVRIPISDAVDSLNVSVAVAIALHALRMNRQ